MLKYNESNIVEFVAPAQKLKESIALIEEYKDDKDLLQKILVYVYNVYSPKSIYSEFLPDQRKDRICSDLFESKIKKEYFDSALIKEFIALYVEMSLTAVQRDHEMCKQDIAKLHEYISSIQFTKKERVRRTITFRDDDLDKDFAKDIDMVIEIDNSEEKIKAIAVREKLYAIDQRLRKLVETEKIEQELSAKTMFEES
jgi:hypothetical protein